MKERKKGKKSSAAKANDERSRRIKALREKGREARTLSGSDGRNARTGARARVRPRVNRSFRNLMSLSEAENRMFMLALQLGLNWPSLKKCSALELIAVLSR